jgi:small subunit ribosomal protein S1
MNENKNEIINPTENFEDMLNNNFINNDFFEPGELVNAQIVKLTGDWVFINIGGKSEGYLEAGELKDDKGKLTIKEGDNIKAYFLSSKDGELHFTTRISEGRIGQKILQSAFENGVPVDGFVNQEIKGGFEIKVGSSRAFCPYSQMGLDRESPEKFLGKNFKFKITEFAEGGRNVILSNRAILELEKKLKIEELKKVLTQGMKVKGVIKSIQDFGAFVDIGGVQALVPVSEISRGRVENVNDYLKAGQEIEAVILNIDWAKEKISLSMKDLLPDPWNSVSTKYPEGSLHSGKVVRITTFGAFVTLEPGIDGLIHISSLGGSKRIKHPKEVVKEGDTLSVVVMKTDIEKKRISLKLHSTVEEEKEDSIEEFLGESEKSFNPFGNLGNILKEKK